MGKTWLICTLAVILMASQGTGKELEDEMHETPRTELRRQRRTLGDLGQLLNIAKTMFPNVFGGNSSPQYPQWPQMPQGYNFPQMPGLPLMPGFPQMFGYPQMQSYPPIPSYSQGSHFPQPPYPPVSTYNPQGLYNPQGHINPLGRFNPPPQYGLRPVTQPNRVPVYPRI